MIDCLSQFVQSLQNDVGAWERSFDIWKCKESFVVDLGISIDVLFQEYSQADTRYPLIRVYRDGIPVDQEDYTYTWRYGGEEFNDVIDIEKIRAMMQCGCTIIFQSLEQHFPAINKLCRDIEDVVFCPIQANAFYTTQKTPGVAPHYDSSDVIVMQIGGNKRWNIWGFREYLATGKSRYRQNLMDDYIANNKIEDSFVLSKGDALYLPRGLVHQAIAEQQESLHISFIFHNIRWSSILAEAVKDICSELSEKEEYRSIWRNSDARYPTSSSANSVPNKDAFLGEILENLTADRVRKLVYEKVRSSSFTSRRGRLLDIVNLKEIDEHSVIIVRPDYPFSIKLEQDTVKVSGTDRTISFPKNAYAALKDLKEGDGKKVGELSGLISVGSKISIAKMLVKSGICRIEKIG